MLKNILVLDNGTEIAAGTAGANAIRALTVTEAVSSTDDLCPGGGFLPYGTFGVPHLAQVVSEVVQANRVDGILISPEEILTAWKEAL